MSSEPFPSSGRILLGAAGGGREIAGLAARGYDVLAFEPNPVLVEGAVATARGAPNTHVVRASYADLVSAATSGQGPLANPIKGVRFDGVILGWGSLTHVVQPDARVATLKAIRSIAPSAPVLASFYLRRPDPATPGRSERAKLLIRRVFKGLGAKRYPAQGLSYQRTGGFVYCFLKEEIVELAAACGYRVYLLTDREFPHALLVPVA